MLNNNILIIDDEPIIIESMRKDLEKEGFNILSAKNGKEGLEIFEKESPILIILDIRMPVMDGIEFLEHVKPKPSDPYSLIVLTGHGDNEDTQKCFSLGISSFLNKPYNVHVLRGMVKHSIELKQTQSKSEYLASFPKLNTNPIIEVNAGGAITFYNNAVTETLKTLGFSNKNIDLFLPKNMNDILNALKHKKDKQLNHEVKISNRIFLENIHLVPQFNVVRIYTRDITEHKHAEEKIRKLFTAVEQSPSVVVITDTKGDIEYVNPKFTELTEYRAEEIIGKNSRILKSGELSSEVYKQLWNKITSGAEWQCEFHNRKKSGELYWELASISAIRDSKGNITHFIKVAEDITKRKMAEAELTKARDELLHSEKLSAIGKLSASIAHEFNNPICGIKNVLDTIKERYVCENIDEEEEELVKIAINECDRISNLINNLKDFYRPSSAISSMVNIHEIIDEIALLSKKKLHERKVLLEKHYDADIPLIKVVPDQIEQVILNLIQNAEESIPEKGGRIVITTEHDNTNVIIHISDTGCGIPQQYIGSIFEPFFSTKPEVKGTGLGLSVCHGIIKNHGGDLKAESREGNGTTFSVTIPVEG